MTGRYSKELDRLSLVYEAAVSADISSLTAAIKDWSRSPMVMIGSGGSFSTASFAAWLHEHRAQRMARAASPLDVIGAQTLQHGAVCFSASGRNRDIGAAFKACALREIAPLNALVMAKNTPLHALSERYSYSEIISVEDPSFKDGFLAVATMIASSVLLVRAYRLAIGLNEPIPTTLTQLLEATVGPVDLSLIAESAERVTGRDFTSVLYSETLKPAAIDLESRFVEASLGALHAADLRNFGHGRHFWFANRGEDTGIVALISQDDCTLADRTLDLVPAVDVLRLDFHGPSDLIALSGLICGLYISQGAGRSAGIDPGKPGVPDFGRRLYRLGPSPNRSGPQALNKRAAISRKTRATSNSDQDHQLDWETAYETAIEAVRSAKIGAVVLDYDGTLCDPARRFDAMPIESGEAINRLLDNGAQLAIATGRGPSAGKAMRARINEDYWESVLVGYYNGAVLTNLSDQTDPLLTETPANDPFLSVLSEVPMFKGRRISANARQVSISLGAQSNARHGLVLAASILAQQDLGETKMVASSHSIDLLLGGQSKLDVVAAIAQRAGCKSDEVLRIGDKGAWPGNDTDLLNHWLGLSVEETNPDPSGCWNFAPAGIVGLQAAIYYLNDLQWRDGTGRLALSSRMKRGAT